eukprot:COSAG05_NODE_21398_length_272_cov_0.601156_1_plen_67_part_10
MHGFSNATVNISSLTLVRAGVQLQLVVYPSPGAVMSAHLALAPQTTLAHPSISVQFAVLFVVVAPTY